MLAASLAFALAACTGSTGPAGGNGSDGTNGTNGTNGSNGANGTNGTNGTNGSNGLPGVSAGLKVTVTGVTLAAGVPTVAFKLSDNRGNPVDRAGAYSVNTAIGPRFGLAKVTTDASGNVLPYTVLTVSGTSPSMLSPSATGNVALVGSLVEVGTGAGTYAYTYPASVTVDAASNDTHVVWIQASRQSDIALTTNAKTFTTVNQDYSWIPSGTGTVVKREVVTTANCNACHAGFKPESATNVGGFHGYGRIAGEVCNVCHNPARASNPSADSSVFVHRLHRGEMLQSYTSGNRMEGSQVDPAANNGFRTCSATSPCVCTVALPCTNKFHNMAATYPQDLRNCAACHGGAAQAGQLATRQTRQICGSCHDYVAFDASAGGTCTNPVTVGANGVPLPCNHVGGAQTTDAGCVGCHGTGAMADIAVKHVPVALTDPCNELAYFAAGNVLAPGCAVHNIRTNAGALPAANMLPPGAARMTAVVGNVLVEGNGNPSINFKLQRDGVDVVFNAAASSNELIDGFTGGPTLYFAFSVPQDGIDAPADFNATASGPLKGIWNGTSTAGTLAGPDAAGFYKVTLTGAFVPATASMLTGGVGYEYSLSANANPARIGQPLTQTNVPGYTYDAATHVGGLVTTMPNVWKTAIGFTARRTIVDNEKCKACHEQLGVLPSFHVGQRNDGPTCSFCHTPNRTSSGWSANSKDFLHALHAGRVRSVPFTWHAVSPTDNFAEVEFPSRLNNCMACHTTVGTGNNAYATYDLSAPALEAVVPNLLWSTVAAGNLVAQNAAGSISPYALGAIYGSGFSYNAGTNVMVAAQGNTLVASPITAACIACHDSNAAYSHMDLNGGTFYQPRNTMAAGYLGVGESCLVCHGKGAVADVNAAHQ